MTFEISGGAFFAESKPAPFAGELDWFVMCFTAHNYKYDCSIKKPINNSTSASSRLPINNTYRALPYTFNETQGAGVSCGNISAAFTDHTIHFFGNRNQKKAPVIRPIPTHIFINIHTVSMHVRF